jgi:hypothetical protein
MDPTGEMVSKMPMASRAFNGASLPDMNISFPLIILDARDTNLAQDDSTVAGGSTGYKNQILLGAVVSILNLI